MHWELMSKLLGGTFTETPWYQYIQYSDSFALVCLRGNKTGIHPDCWYPILKTSSQILINIMHLCIFLITLICKKMLPRSCVHWAENNYLSDKSLSNHKHKVNDMHLLASTVSILPLNSGTPNAVR